MKGKIDRYSLKYFLEQRLSSKEQQKWVTKMLGYDFEIIYKKGKLNVVADALSRKNEEVEALICAISMNGRMMKKCGHSFKSCSKFPVHLIHLVIK